MVGLHDIGCVTVPASRYRVVRFDSLFRRSWTVNVTTTTGSCSGRCGGAMGVDSVSFGYFKTRIPYTLLRGTTPSRPQ